PGPTRTEYRRDARPGLLLELHRAATPAAVLGSAVAGCRAAIPAVARLGRHQVPARSLSLSRAAGQPPRLRRRARGKAGSPGLGRRRSPFPGAAARRDVHARPSVARQLLMSDATLWLYHRLPSAARSAAASLRGYYLRWWRYGRDTDRLIAEALERDGWTATQWDRWREQRLAYVLHRAATRVPYYRDQWQARRRRRSASGTPGCGSSTCHPTSSRRRSCRRTSTRSAATA